MNSFPLISVITVSYNAADVIEKTILSVINQTYPNIEYIIIDGGSSDTTVEIIKKYKDKISFWVSEKDGGIYYGMNKGIEQSHGDWLCFMNSGDEFCSNSVIADIVNGGISAKIGVVFGDVILDYPPYGKVLKRHDNLKGEDLPMCLCHQSTLTKGVLLRELKYDTSFRIFADINAFHELWKKGVGFQYVPLSMAVFEGFEGISSSKPWVSFKEINRIRGHRWYNSATWWKQVLIIMIKSMMEACMTEEKFRYKKYQRIAEKYIKLT